MAPLQLSFCSTGFTGESAAQSDVEEVEVGGHVCKKRKKKKKDKKKITSDDQRRRRSGRIEVLIEERAAVQAESLNSERP